MPRGRTQKTKDISNSENNTVETGAEITAPVEVKTEQPNKEVKSEKPKK